ncbi:SPOR domain-containing protein [Hyphomicrobium methylovorum]|uniref:SPOR domain-containing protein n=1 Tax=Hyphomicrobium methylovorum TaxID=84 RepID=UPI0015E71793|nr:SPOR domain-containing protein [Hyphomicrobium methylovorum]MBA2127815.1 SPOR domain-containing protein [Hyphomicrobium methylovorum]
MTKPASDKTGRAKAGTSYAVLWSMLGALGAGYLGVAIFAPNWLGELTPGNHLTQSAQTDAAVLKLAADVDGIRSSLTRLELDVASVKSDVGNQQQQTHTLSEQVTAIEDKMRLAEAPPAASAQQMSQSGTDVEGIPEPATTTAEAAPPSPSTRIINASPEHPIVTGSVDKAAVPTKTKAKAKAASNEALDFGTAVVKQEAKPIGLQIGSDSSVEGLRMSWIQIAALHNDRLKTFKPRYTSNGDPNNPNFQLVAGPVKTKADAIRICKELNAQNVTCKVGDFIGNAL